MVRMKRLGLGLASITALSLALVPVAGAADHFDPPVMVTVNDPGPTGDILRSYKLTSPLDNPFGAAGCEAPTLRILCVRDETLLVVTIDMGPAVRR